MAAFYFCMGCSDITCLLAGKKQLRPVDTDNDLQVMGNNAKHCFFLSSVRQINDAHSVRFLTSQNCTERLNKAVTIDTEALR